ncbi:hypothetical protein FRB91_011405 [Serendipita sp. 411]|nr:hypothetical protein FRC19_008189 [Serendipita sp. 401]KAG8837262.1 hypothetical protein FRC18_009670 [Serendipita sp. 400]KAG8857389.1 hypothetical protein FRB91_011405 [Serendipita sp. 411]
MYLRLARPLRNSRSFSRALSTRASNILSSLGLESKGVLPGVYDGRQWAGTGTPVKSKCPTTGEHLVDVSTATPAEFHNVIESSREAFESFRMIPAPRRGEILRQIREALAAKRDQLGALISLEMGKIMSEGIGEVQEFIDICDYAVGLSRMMNGRVIASERPGHSILEVPNPLGLVAVISAFNFPMAVYGWNLALSFVAGNATLWKPSPSTPLCSVAITRIVADVLERNGINGAVASLVTGDSHIGDAICESEHVTLVSFTGSEQVGAKVGKKVQGRFGKVLLELGGNNASIVMPDADLSMAVPSVFFGAVGTAGQRCTSTRRLYLHRNIAPKFLDALKKAYASIPTGDPLVSSTLLGPLHNKMAVQNYHRAVMHLHDMGAEVLTGGKVASPSGFEGGNFVQATIAVPPSHDLDLWKKELFAPILNVAIFDELEEAIQLNNSVHQGLSSSIWTKDVRNIGQFLGPAGSDCGIVNVNVGTSGAEIGAAFGGNKRTGWGRESGGDSWKQYVRWSACTINYSNEAPLAQGVNFSL